VSSCHDLYRAKLAAKSCNRTRSFASPQYFSTIERAQTQINGMARRRCQRFGQAAALNLSK
jgi:hypothetical protein